MADWDADDWDAEAPVVPAKPAFPVRQVVPDAWDDEDVSEEESPIVTSAAPKPSAPMKPSKALALALKAKEKEEQEREAARIRAREEELAAVSEAERKMRLQQIVEEADMDNARSLFGEDTGFVPPEEDDKSIDKFKPKTPEELEKLAEMIGKKCRSLSTNPKRTENYVTFLKSLMRKLTLELDADDCKELSTHMGIIANERRDAFKRARGIKKKSASKKANVRVGKASDVRDARDDAYNDSYNDFDDYAFM